MDGAAALAVLALVLCGVLALWVLSLQLRLAAVRKHYNMLAAGVDRGTLTELLEHYLRQLERLEEHIKELDRAQRTVDQALRRTIQRVGVVRFNPFPDTGGDQSFAIALLDADDNGAVFSSLHTRSGTRFYAKPLVGGRSSYLLTADEERAILEAKGLSVAPPASEQRS